MTPPSGSSRCCAAASMARGRRWTDAKCTGYRHCPNRLQVNSPHVPRSSETRADVTFVANLPSRQSMIYRDINFRRSTPWSMALILCGQFCLLAEDSPIQPARPSPEVIAAWEKAGAEFGWIVSDASGNEEWRSD